jgi:hypothetical protein
MGVRLVIIIVEGGRLVISINIGGRLDICCKIILLQSRALYKTSFCILFDDIKHFFIIFRLLCSCYLID